MKALQRHSRILKALTRVTFLFALFLSNYSVCNAQNAYTDSLVQVATNVGLADTKRIMAYNTLSAYLKSYDPKRATAYGQEGLEMAKKIQSQRGIGDAYYALGTIKYLTADYHQTIEYINYALEAYEKMDAKVGIAYCYITLGTTYQNLGNYDKSLNLLQKALTLGREIKDVATESSATMSLGNIYTYIHDYENAKGYYQKAVNLQKKHGIATLYVAQINLGLAYQNLASTQERDDYLDSAINNYGIALIVANKYNDVRTIGQAHNYLGLIYDSRNNNALSLEHYLKALKAYENIDNDFLKAYLNASLCEAYRKVGRLNSALKYGELAVQMAEKLGIHDVLKFTHQKLFPLYYALNRSPDAEESLKKFILHNDSTLSEQKNTQIANLEVKYETEKKQQEIEILQAETKFSELQLSRNRYLLASTIIIAGLLIAGILLMTSRRRQKLKASLAFEKQKHQKQQFRSIIESEEKERKRIAQELHDGLGQLLSLARLNVASLEAIDQEDINNSVQMLDTAIDEIRSISHNMMPNSLISIGLSSALQDLAHNITEMGKIQVHYNNSLKFETSESQSIAIYRATQEVLNNVIKHAKATEIDFQVSEKNEDIEVIIKDNGVGFDTKQAQGSKGIGWKNIFSRIDLIGGQIDITSKLNIGTTINICVPKNELGYQVASTN